MEDTVLLFVLAVAYVACIRSDYSAAVMIGSMAILPAIAIWARE